MDYFPQHKMTLHNRIVNFDLILKILVRFDMKRGTNHTTDAKKEEENTESKQSNNKKRHTERNNIR